MTKREAALERAKTALERWSRGEITKHALLEAIAKLQATKPAHKQ